MFWEGEKGGRERHAGSGWNGCNAYNYDLYGVSCPVGASRQLLVVNWANRLTQNGGINQHAGDPSRPGSARHGETLSSKELETSELLAFSTRQRTNLCSNQCEQSSVLFNLSSERLSVHQIMGEPSRPHDNGPARLAVAGGTAHNHVALDYIMIWQ